MVEAPQLQQNRLRAGFQPLAAQPAGSAPADSKTFYLTWNRSPQPMSLQDPFSFHLLSMQCLPALLVWLLKSEWLVAVCMHAGCPEPDILVALFLCLAGGCPIAVCHPSFTTASSAVFSGFERLSLPLIPRFPVLCFSVVSDSLRSPWT